MDELAATRRHAERQQPGAPALQSQFIDLVKRISSEFTALRTEVSALRHRVQQLETKGGRG